ncbi:MAG: hypothetical protein KC800_11605 [Candidatus Eremiobacteraeota bacterium]|nr:hypothetical protein [Candidatus Eremiobacteraeota bacterium]
MTVVRRILIGVVGLLLLLDVAALGIVKFGTGPAPSDEKTKVAIWIDDKGQADAAVKMLAENGYAETFSKPGKRETFVEADFRVVMEASRKELLDPVANVLKRGGHKNLSFNKEGTELYYGGVYQTKAEAKKVAAKLEKQEMLVFDVKPGQKKVMRDSFKVIIPEVPSNMVSEATSPVETEYEVVNIEEYPLAPKESEATEEATEDEG